MKPQITKEDILYHSSQLTVKSLRSTSQSQTTTQEFALLPPIAAIIAVNHKHQVFLESRYNSIYDQELTILPTITVTLGQSTKTTNHIQNYLKSHLGVSSSKIIRLGKSFPALTVHQITNFYLATKLTSIPNHQLTPNYTLMPLKQALATAKKQPTLTSTITGLYWALESLSLISFRP